MTAPDKLFSTQSIIPDGISVFAYKDLLEIRIWKDGKPGQKFGLIWEDVKRMQDEAIDNAPYAVMRVLPDLPSKTSDHHADLRDAQREENKRLTKILGDNPTRESGK